jgi:hypothetical protein
MSLSIIVARSIVQDIVCVLIDKQIFCRQYFYIHILVVFVWRGMFDLTLSMFTVLPVVIEHTDSHYNSK